VSTVNLLERGGDLRSVHDQGQIEEAREFGQCSTGHCLRHPGRDTRGRTAPRQCSFARPHGSRKRAQKIEAPARSEFRCVRRCGAALRSTSENRTAPRGVRGPACDRTVSFNWPHRGSQQAVLISPWNSPHTRSARARRRLTSAKRTHGRSTPDDLIDVRIACGHKGIQRGREPRSRCCAGSCA